LLDGRARAELLLRLGRWMPSVANAMVHATRGTVLAFDEAAGFDSSVLLKGEKE